MKTCLTREPFQGPVLEIGAGRDRFVRNLFGRRHKVATVNIYPQNVVDRVASVTSLPFKDGEFGCVVCAHVLEHVDDPQQALAEIARVLRPGGLFILVSPFSCAIHEKPYDLWRFTEEGLRHLLRKDFKEATYEAYGRARNPRFYGVTARAAAPAERRRVSPRVSVIMPTYNRGHLIAFAIESILKQTFRDWELIVVSDGSTDRTRQVVRGYQDPRIKFYQKANAGCAAARNYGLRRATGEYIAYCDDDDALMPHHLQLFVNTLDRHPETGMVRGYSVTLTKNNEGYLYIGFLWALMHRRSHLRDVGLLDETLLIAEDTDFILRYADRHPVKQLNVIVSWYTRHDEGVTTVHRDRHDPSYDAIFSKRVDVIFRDPSVPRSYFPFLACLLVRRGAVAAAEKLAARFKKRYHRHLDIFADPFLSESRVRKIDAGRLRELSDRLFLLACQPDTRLL